MSRRLPLLGWWRVVVNRRRWWCPFQCRLLLGGEFAAQLKDRLGKRYAVFLFYELDSIAPFWVALITHPNLFVCRAAALDRKSVMPSTKWAWRVFRFISSQVNAELTCQVVIG